MDITYRLPVNFLSVRKTFRWQLVNLEFINKMKNCFLSEVNPQNYQPTMVTAIAELYKL